jgi:hypothetical protein
MEERREKVNRRALEREWGMGNGEWDNLAAVGFHSLFPISHYRTSNHQTFLVFHFPRRNNTALITASVA